MIHKHHIIPVHAGGSDDLSNIKEVTIAEHAEEHRLLWKQYGRYQDWCAWKGLSAKIGREEIYSIIAKINGRLGGLSLKGKPKSEEHKKKILSLKQAFRKGDAPWNKGKTSNQETRDKISRSLTGKKQSQKTIQKRATSNSHPRGKYKKG